ncbi:hypothetical protein [Vibrio pelagius]|nr:hypothetical protein [Vibrio pelagius]
MGTILATACWQIAQHLFVQQVDIYGASISCFTEKSVFWDAGREL